MLQDSFRSRPVAYQDARLGLSVAGRFLVRVVSGATLVMLAAVAALGLLSDVPPLRGAGLLALLILAERFLYRGHADSRLSELAAQPAPNLAGALTPAAYQAVERAFDASRLARQPLGVGLLQQLLRDRSVQRALGRTEADLDALADPDAEPLAAPLAPDETGAFLGAASAAAGDIARSLGADEIEPVTLMAGLIVSGDAQVSRVTARARLTDEDLAYAAQAAALESRSTPRLPRVVPHHIMNRAWTSRPTPALDAIAGDLTDLARVGALPKLVGHTQAYENAVTALAKPVHPHVLMIAPPGGGKDTVAGEVARAIVAGTAPAPLLDRRLVRIDVAALMAAGGSDPAGAVKRVADEIVVAGNVVLYIPDFEHLAQGSGAYMAAADILLPILTADTFPVLAATTPEAYARILETRGDVAGTFEVIRLSPLPVPDAVSVLALSARDLERANRVGISVGALRTAASLAARYLAPARPLPGSALDLLAETAQIVRAGGGKRVTSADVERAIEKQTHVPVGAASEAEAGVLLGLEATLAGRVIGQDEAVHAVSEAVRAYRAGLVTNDAPPSFLFVGPTGVGKTELAKALADAVYGKEAFTRLDMSEFSEAGSVARLLGTREVPGALTEPVRVSPHRLMLLDEIEKASPEAIRLLLQVIGDGRITDGLGRPVSFADTLVVATSNAHAELLRDALRRGEGVASMEGYLRERLSDVFPTELLNRFTRIVIFRDLSPDELSRIARLTIAAIAKLLDARYGVTLEADDAALKEIVRTGYDPQWGARPLRRSAESALDSVLAPLLIAGKVPRGSRVTLTHRDGAYALVEL